MFNFPTDPIEIIAVITGIIQVMLAYKKSIYTYPFGIISSILYVQICFSAGIFADMSIMIYYFIMSIYGWINWNSLMKKNHAFIPSENSLSGNINWFLITLVMWCGLYFILKYFGSTVPILDGFTTAFCITGTYLMARKKIENWIFLLIGDVVSVPLYFYKELYFTVLLYVVLCLFAVLGYYSWKKNLVVKE